jgi:hypothetical protein
MSTDLTVERRPLTRHEYLGQAVIIAAIVLLTLFLRG